MSVTVNSGQPEASGGTALRRAICDKFAHYIHRLAMTGGLILGDESTEEAQLEFVTLSEGKVEVSVTMTSAATISMDDLRMSDAEQQEVTRMLRKLQGMSETCQA